MFELAIMNEKNNIIHLIKRDYIPRQGETIIIGLSTNQLPSEVLLITQVVYNIIVDDDAKNNFIGIYTKQQL